MKFLHTADWHLGREVRGRSREPEHRAALEQILAHAREQAVDCLLLAGDIFDTATPSPESERLAYEFFCELHGASIPAVAIAGNHDHPRRIDAVAPLLRALRVHAVGRPVGAQDGGVTEIDSRDGREQAVIAALPWVGERDTLDFASLRQEAGVKIAAYAERVGEALKDLARAFPPRPDAVSVLVAHLFMDEAEAGPGGGERPLSVDRGIYGIRQQMLPPEAQYVALGHVHKPQFVRRSPPAWYSGSPLQMDFGEQRQQKFVNLIEAHPGQPAEVTQLPMTAGRALLDVGTPQHGVHLAELPTLVEGVGDAWLRVFVEMEAPLANLPAVVREHLPNAVHVQPVKHEAPAANDQTSLAALEDNEEGARELFARFYRSPRGRGREPSAATTERFLELWKEERDAALEA